MVESKWSIRFNSANLLQRVCMILPVSEKLVVTVPTVEETICTSHDKFCLQNHSLAVTYHRNVGSAKDTAKFSQA